MLNRRKKRPLQRDKSTLRDAKLLVIATEGSDTEPLYFNAIDAALGDSRVRLHVIPSEGGKSSPGHIINNINAYAAEHEIGTGDRLWVVIDRDRWDEENLSQVAAECVQKKYGLAVSNPFFEIWLAFHFGQDLPGNVNKTTINKHLRQCLGSYSKSRFDSSHFLIEENINYACARARDQDISPRERWPGPNATRVYRIIEELRKLKR